MRHLPAAALVLAPSSALACGMCVDMGAARAVWWSHALPVAAMVLVIEVVVAGVAFRALKYRPRVRRGRLLAVALVLGVASSLSLGGSGMGLGAGVGLVLLPAFVVSVIRELPGSTWPRVLRGAAVLAVVVLVGVVPRHPAARDTDELIRLATYPGGAGASSGWVLDELRRRDDALATLERRALEADTPGAAGRSLSLHRRLDGPAEARRRACERWRDQLREGTLETELEAACR